MLDILSSCTHTMGISQKDTAAGFIVAAQKSLMKTMDKKDYNDFDWPHAVLYSLDSGNQESLLQVTSKTDTNKTLYYSVLDKTKRMFLVSVSLDTNVSGSIEIFSVKNKPLKKFTLKENRVIKDELYDRKPGDSLLNCPHCFLPPYIIVGQADSVEGDFFLYIMFYTFGGGEGWQFVQTPPGKYGSGGYYKSPFYDRYACKAVKYSIRNIFVDVNPDYYREPIKATEHPVDSVKRL